MTQDFRDAILFYAMALGLAVAVRVAVPWLGHGVLAVTMLTPALAVLLLLLRPGQPGGWREALRELGLTRAGLRAWPAAVGLPAVIQMGGLVILAASGLTALLRPEGSLPDVALDLVAQMLIVTVFSVGEEIGWRGYLLPRMMTRLGPVAAMLAVGLMHGLWHMPLLLTTDLYHESGTPWIVAPMFLVTLTLAGVFYGWLRVWSGSVWPVAIAHAAVNTCWELASRMSATRTPLVMEYIGGESGLLMIAALALLVGVLIPRLRQGGKSMAPRPLAA